MLSPGWATRLLSRYWLLVPLLVIVVVLIDRVETPSTFELEDTISMRDTHSDYYLSEFRSRKFDSEGRVVYTVEGDTLAHYPHNDQSEISTPRVQLLRENTLWQIRSDNGLFDTNPDRFTLEGDVIIRRLSDSGSDPVTITTRSLTVATESNEVTTDEAIEISAPGWHLQAVGMKSTIDDGKLTLLSDVTARYEVPEP